MRPSNELYASFGKEKKRELTKSRRPYVCEFVENDMKIISERIKGTTILRSRISSKTNGLLLCNPNKKILDLVMDIETSEWCLFRWYYKADIKDQIQTTKDLINKKTTELYILQEHEEERKSEVHFDLAYFHYRHSEFNKMLNKMIKWEEQELKEWEQELREWELLHEDK